MTLRAEQYDRLARLTDDQARVVLSRHRTIPQPDEPATTRLLALAVQKSMDQRLLLMPCFRTQDQVEISAIETIVGKPITRIHKATKHAGLIRPGRPRPPKPDDNRVITQVTPNPKKPGSASYERYAKYQPGMTVQEALNAGVTTGDIKWDSERGFITLV